MQSTFSKEKKLLHELMKLPGLGFWKAQQICSEFGMDPSMKIGELSRQELDLFTNSFISKHYVGNDLKKLVANDIQNLIDINCHRGLCHRRGLPVRGQSTHTNAQTAKKRTKL
jgi:small subunit ribosomal protein S13|tara:strand:- start:15000 stop:15338 length:339 start_codon:yes stop_codon:yes gene_type:complete